MHELSVALNIIEIVNSAFDNSNAEQVNNVELEIGKFSGIELDALEFALRTTMESSHLRDTKIEITRVEGKGRCNKCKTEFKMLSLYDECPECKSYEIDLLQGRELKVKSINVD